MGWNLGGSSFYEFIFIKTKKQMQIIYFEGLFQKVSATVILSLKYNFLQHIIRFSWIELSLKQRLSENFVMRHGNKCQTEKL